MNRLPVLRRVALLCATGLCVACAGEDAQVLDLATEKEANEVLVLLDRFGVPGSEKAALTVQRKTAWRVTIAKSHGRAARFVLDRLGLPREDRGGLGLALESGGVIPSASADRSRLLHAKADKLARTLETHDRVVTARVHVVQPERQLAAAKGDDLPPSTASVYVRYLPEHGESNADATPLGPEDVQSLVSNSIEGLSPEDVRVIYSPIDLALARSEAGERIVDPEIASLIEAESGRLARLRQLDRPLAWLAAAVTALTGFLCILLRRERARSRTALEAHVQVA